MRKEDFFSEILRELARSKNERARRHSHITTEKRLQVLLQVMVYDCNHQWRYFCTAAKTYQSGRVCVKTAAADMSVYIKMKAFELARTINEVFPVVEFESEGGGKV